MALNTPTEERLADALDRLRDRIADEAIHPGALWNDADIHDVVIRLWMGNEERAHRLFAELRGIAGRTDHWKFGDIRDAFAAKTFEKLARSRSKAEEADAPTRTRKPHGVPPVAEMIPRFNELWMHTRVGSDEAVMDLHSLDLLKRRTFVNMHEHVLVTTGFGKDGEPTFDNAATAWLAHKDHAIAMAGLVFKPDQNRGLLDVGSPIGQAYNTWTGFGVEPIEGDISEFRTFMQDGLCAGNETNFNYVWNYHALVCQKPAEPGAVHPIFASPTEGTGKGIFGNAMCSLVGHRHAAFITDPDQVTGRFNYTLANKCYVVIDEGIYAGDPKAAAKFRSLVTEPKIRLERKYFDSIEVDNYVSYLSISNAAHVAHASRTSRRPVVFTPALWHYKDYDYWAKMKGWLYDNDKRGLAHLLYAFKHTNLSAYEPRNLPITAATIEQRVLTARREPWGYFQDVAKRGYVYKSRYGHAEVFDAWMLVVSTRLLYAGYEQWADAQRLGTFQRVTYAGFGDFLTNELKLPATRPQNMIVDEDSREGDSGILRKRAWAYQLGTPEEFQAVLAARMSGDDTLGAGQPRSPLPEPPEDPEEQPDQPDEPIDPHGGGLFGGKRSF